MPTVLLNISPEGGRGEHLPLHELLFVPVEVTEQDSGDRRWVLQQTTP